MEENEVNIFIYFVIKSYNFRDNVMNASLKKIQTGILIFKIIS